MVGFDVVHFHKKDRGDAVDLSKIPARRNLEGL